MPELETPVVQTPAVDAPAVATPAPGAPTPPPHKAHEKKRKGKKIRNTIIALVVIAALAVGGWFLYSFLNKKEAVNSEIQSGVAQTSSIQSTVQGNGVAKAKESAAIALTAGGTVEQVLVEVGQKVMAGEALYVIRSQAAEDAVTAAQETVNNLLKDMADLEKQRANLTVRAPFSGKLVEIGEFQTGSTVTKGAAVATLVNDKKLKLSLYFSYAYEGSIYAGQSVNVSIPAVMNEFTGTVESINKVHYISPEGADHFEVVISFLNAGTLTEGMSASASMTTADGTPIYPYENGTTEFYESRKIITEADGPLLKDNLLRYANVNAGDTLLSLSSETLDASVRAKQKEIDTANEKLTEAQKGLQNFNATAPIDGTITSCTLSIGAEVKSGDTVITLSNDSTMVVEITVDDRNIAFVKPGMMVDLTSGGDGSMFQGVVTKIDMSLGGGNNQGGGGGGSQGMTNYPVTLEVDNMGGTLLAGMWLQYSFVASQSDDCIVVPMQSVKYISDAEGNTAAAVFIMAETKPENALEVEMPQADPNAAPTYPSEKDGYYAVPVVTGLSDNYNVEIKEGLMGGETVFVNFLVESASSWG